MIGWGFGWRSNIFISDHWLLGRQWWSGKSVIACLEKGGFVRFASVESVDFSEPCRRFKILRKIATAEPSNRWTP